MPPRPVKMHVSETTPLTELISLDGQVALVTGAAQGFGRRCVERLSEAGAAVAAVDRQATRLQQVVADLRERGRSAVGITADVTDEPDVERAVAETVETFGSLHILVNNAGIFSNRLVDALDLAEFRRIFAVNLEGTYMFTRAAVRAFRAQEVRGSVVNISSIDALRPTAPGLAHYDASKHAVKGLTRTLALELAPEGIRVNAVAPGFARTEGVEEEIARRATGGIDVEAQWDGLIERVPMGRLVDADDVARAVLFLASDLSSFVTGTLLVVDGGSLLK